MIRNGDIIEGYTILATANGKALAHSETAPDPYVVWFIDADGCGVHTGYYRQTKEDAEWDFCCKAFPWFEDNAPVNMIEDEAEKRIQEFNYFLDEAKNAVDLAKALVEDMVLEYSRLHGKEEAPQQHAEEHKKKEVVERFKSIIEKNTERFVETLIGTISSVNDIDSVLQVLDCGFPLRYAASSIWEDCSSNILKDIWDINTSLL